MLQIDGYEIIGELGKGGMASVYKAIQFPLDRLVALKVLSPHLFTASPQFGERFERETKILAKFAHAGIVRVYDAGRQGDYYYLAMEMLEGGTLTDRLENKNISGVKETLVVIQKLAQALAHSHQKHIIHRDIKPDNILFRSEKSNEPVLADYGIAKSIDNSDSLTVDASIIGSPTYMSPEQALGQKITEKTDVFSLGVVFFQAITGRLPFPSGNIGELALAHRDGLKDETFDDPERIICQKLWLKMLEKDVEKRPSAQALDALIEKELQRIPQLESASDATVIRPVDGSNLQGGTDLSASKKLNKKYVRFIYSSVIIVFCAVAAVYYMNMPREEAGFQVADAVACCSIDQLEQAVKIKKPEYLEFFVPDNIAAKTTNGIQYLGQWVARASGYQAKAIATKMGSLPKIVTLEWRKYFTPEEFYDYQALLAGDIQSPNDFILKYQHSVFAPIAALLGEPTSNQLKTIKRYAKQNDPVAQFQLSEIYDNGLAPAKKDSKEALRWATASAEQGYLPAKLQLFVFAVQSGELQPGSEAYDTALRALVEQEFWLAQYLYAMYQRQLVGSASVKQWLPFLEYSASAGDFKSHQALLEIYTSKKYSDQQLAITTQLRNDKAKLHKRRANQLISRLLQ